MTEDSPTIIVLGGPNGAGKTSSARTLLADTLSVLTFVNADVIAQGLAGFDPDSAAIEASRIMLDRLRALAARRESFAFETTLAARSYAAWLHELRQTGYIVHLIYFWLATADLAVNRVAERVRFGGHDVPQKTIRQRYQRSLTNFFTLYSPQVNFWRVYDNTEANRTRLVAYGTDAGADTVVDVGTWEMMQERTAK